MQTDTANPVAAEVANLYEGGTRVASFHVVNSDASAHQVSFWDSPDAATTWSRPEFDETEIQETSVQLTYTDFLGKTVGAPGSGVDVEREPYDAMERVTSTVAADASHPRNQTKLFDVPAGGSVSFEPVTWILHGFGITYDTAGPVSITVEHAPVI